MSTSFVAPNYLIQYQSPASVCDYRCVVDPTGTTVVFERAKVTGQKTTGPFNLYSLDLASGTVSEFLQGSTLPTASDRPDICWDSIGAFAGQVAFNWIDSSGLQVGVANSDGSNAGSLGTGTLNMSYPTWIPAGTLAVMDQSDNASPSPSTSIIDTNGTLLKQALAGPTMWAGMPSVNQINPNLIVFAGQVVGSGSYHQDRNYIWVVDLGTNPITLAPLEANCPPTGPFDPKYQGRAPWWSPDGKWVVFESDRPSSAAASGLYSIYLYEYGSGPAVQVTDPSYNMNHAKWFPNGFPHYPSGSPTLVVAAWQDAGSAPAWPWGLASLDVSSIVGSP